MHWIKFNPPSDPTLRARAIREVRPLCFNYCSAVLGVDHGSLCIQVTRPGTEEMVLETAIRLEKLGLTVSVENEWS